MTAADRLYTFLRRLAEANQPLPYTGSICSAVGISDKQRAEAMKALVEAGRLRLQKKMGTHTEARRVLFPDGTATPWTVPPKSQLAAFASRRVVNLDLRVKLTDAERAMIDAAVAAGRVTRCEPRYEPDHDIYNRRVTGHGMGV